MTTQPTPTRTQRLTGRALRTLGPHFGHPHGLLGYIAANVMARSNIETNRIVVTTIDPTGLDVLDLGCGPGTALQLAARLERPPASLTGIDQSPEMTRVASNRLRHARRTRSIQLHTAPAEHLPLDDAAFDLVWAINTVHHWTSPGQGLVEVSRVLRPAGHLVIAERYGPPAHRHRPRGADDEQIRDLTTTAERHGLAHQRTDIHTTSNDRFALITFTNTTR
ncbi:MAG: class I SAM-dependent methyltransferase [Acidimicrobiia bacterium]|jgi:SAM-dependent methyltransferase